MNKNLCILGADSSGQALSTLLPETVSMNLVLLRLDQKAMETPGFLMRILEMPTQVLVLNQALDTLSQLAGP